MNRLERFRNAILYLKGQGRVSTKKSIAEAMGASASNVTTAINTGDPKVLTDQFLLRFSRAFDGVFSTEWLISGVGEMLASNELKPESVEELPAPAIDNGSLLNALLAAKDETIAALQDQLAVKEEIIQVKDELIATLRGQLAAMNYEKEIEKLGGYPRDGMASEPLLTPNR